MEIIKINKTSKGKVGDKAYFYNPIVQFNNHFYICKTIKSPVLLNKKLIDTSTLEIQQLIKPEFYQANGISSEVKYLQLVLNKPVISTSFNGKQRHLKMSVELIDPTLVYGYTNTVICPDGRKIIDRISEYRAYEIINS